MYKKYSNKKLTWLVIFTLTTFALVSSACGKEEKVDLKNLPKTFSATMKMNDDSSKSEEMVFTKKEQNIRVEIKTKSGKMISILNADKKKTYLVNSEQKSYMEMPYDEKDAKQSDPFAEIYSQPNTQIEELGSEQVDGHKCKKVRVTVKKDEKEEAITLWCASDLKNMPIKFEGQSADGKKESITLSNISFTVDASAFEPPSDYKLITIPSGIPSPQ